MKSRALAPNDRPLMVMSNTGTTGFDKSAAGILISLVDKGFAPTRYREVVLTVSKHVSFTLLTESSEC